MITDDMVTVGSDQSKQVSISTTGAGVVTQRKEIGSEVAFQSADTITDPTQLIPAGKTVGIFGYQAEPTHTTVRDALLNGDMQLFVTEATKLGLQLLYAVVSWNEQQEANPLIYTITDLRVGIVVKLNQAKTFTQILRLPEGLGADAGQHWFTNVTYYAITEQAGYQGFILKFAGGDGGDGGGEDNKLKFNWKTIAILGGITGGIVLLGAGAIYATKPRR